MSEGPQEVHVIDYAAGETTPRKALDHLRFPYAVTDHRFVYQEEYEDPQGNEGDQVWLWDGRTSPPETRLTDPGEKEVDHARDTLAMGGDFVVYDKRRVSEGLFYWDLSADQAEYPEFLLTDQVEDQDDARMDGNVVVWEATELGSAEWHVYYAFIQQPDIAVVSSDLQFSDDNPTEGDVIDVLTVVRNVTSYDLASDITVRLYDGDPDAGGTQLGSDKLITGGLAGEQTTTVQFAAVSVPLNTRTDEEEVHRIYVRVSVPGIDDRENNTATGELLVRTRGPGEIRGIKWDDVNGDGAKDDAEALLAGWKIYLDKDQDGKWDDGESYDITDQNGIYGIESLPNGFHTVAEEHNEGWEQTYPMPDNSWEVSSPASVVFEGHKLGEGTPAPGGAVLSQADIVDGNPWTSGLAYRYLDGWNRNPRVPADQYDGVGETEWMAGGHAAQGTTLDGLNLFDSDHPEWYAFDFAGYEYDHARFDTNPASVGYGREYRWYDGTGQPWTLWDVRNPSSPVEIGSGTLGALYLDIDYGLVDGDPDIHGTGVISVTGNGSVLYDELMSRWGRPLLHLTLVSAEPPIQSENPSAPSENAWAIFGTQIAIAPVRPDAHIVIIDRGEIEENVNFGNRRLGEIHGIKWNDVDGDGAKDDGEPGLPGWKIYVDANSNGAWDAGELYDITDSTGAYTVESVPAGTHTVAEENKPGWEQTFPVASAIPTDGLLAHYPFDGDFTDATGNGNDGAEHGVTFAEDRGEVPSTAASFDGGDDLVDTLSSESIPSAITLSAWIRPDSNVESCQVFGSSAQASSSSRGYVVNFYDDQLRLEYLKNGVQGPWWTSPESVPPGQWTHVAFTVNAAGEFQWYVNGTPNGQPGQFGTTADAHSHALMIGQSHANQTNAFQGAVDDVRIYDRALSADEVDALYSDASSSTGSVHIVTLGAGDIVEDVSFGNRDMENAPPTLDAITDVMIDEDASEQTLRLTGITAGDGESQPLRITATSDSVALIPNPSVTYALAEANGELTMSPLPNAHGSAVITVTIEDGGLDLDLATANDNATVTREFAITVRPVNDTPTVDLANTVTTLAENADVSSRVKVADILITDDTLGQNELDLYGADATMFMIDSGALYLKAGVMLDYETSPVLDVTVRVDDTSVGETPDDTTDLAITISDVNEVLTLTIDLASISENDGTAQATVHRNTWTAHALVVALSSTDPGEAWVPDEVTIPAGASSVVSQVTAVDDSVVDGTQTLTITASAARGFTAGDDTVDVTDDDTPTLTLTINPPTISEKGGTAQATVHRNTGTDGALVVTLSSDDTSEATVAAAVVIADGDTTTNPFAIEAVHDAIVDGTQMVTITASAAGYRDSSDTLDVLDVVDEDSDGVDDTVEQSGPNNGDGNRDGTPDSRQDNVTSFPNLVDDTYVTLAAPGGTTLSDVTTVGNPSPADAPDDAIFPYGFFDYTLSQLGGNNAATVIVFLHGNEAVNTYYNYGPTPDDPDDHWYPFTYDGQTGAIIYDDRIELHYVDGKRGDRDLATNGVIVDPGAPGVIDCPWRNPVLPQDVNADGNVSPLDVLVLIADINANGPGDLPMFPETSRPLQPPFVDVAGDDNALTPLDVLSVVAYINAHGTSSEGEARNLAALGPVVPPAHVPRFVSFEPDHVRQQPEPRSADLTFWPTEEGHAREDRQPVNDSPLRSLPEDPDPFDTAEGLMVLDAVLVDIALDITNARLGG